MADAEWLCQLLECGLLAGSFIPPADVKAARDVTRYRKLCRHRHSLRLPRPGLCRAAGQRAGCRWWLV